MSSHFRFTNGVVNHAKVIKYITFELTQLVLFPPMKIKHFIYFKNVLNGTFTGMFFYTYK